MRKMILILCLAFASPAVAQAPDDVRPGIFADYDSLRAELDALIEDRAVQDMVIRFGGAASTLQERMAAEAQMRATYPEPLTNVGVMQDVGAEDGFRQLLLAYWGEDDVYLYVYLLVHERDDATIALQMNFNGDPRAFLPLF